ncbi:hypothetical protein OROGR_017843 [Orobanche gracilis]
MAATFMNATFDRLPLVDDDDEMNVACQKFQNNRPRQRAHPVDAGDVYGISQNMLTNGVLPSEGYAWAPCRAPSKA